MRLDIQKASFLKFAPSGNSFSRMATFGIRPSTFGRRASERPTKIMLRSNSGMGCALSISGQSVRLMLSEELGTRHIKIRSARNERWSNNIYWKGCGRSLLPLAVPWIAFSLIRFDMTWHEIIRDNSFPVCMPFRFQNGIFFLKNSYAAQGSKTTSILVRS